VALPVEKDFATRDELLAEVVVGDVPGQQDKPRFRCLQIQSAVMEAAQLLVILVALQATEHAIQNSGAAKDVGIGRQDPVSGHGSDYLRHSLMHARDAGIVGLQDTKRMGQLSDADG